jgi:hypothetical protein
MLSNNLDTGPGDSSHIAPDSYQVIADKTIQALQMRAKLACFAA